MLKKYSNALTVARGRINTVMNDKVFWADKENVSAKVQDIDTDIMLAMRLSQQLDSLNLTVLTLMLNDQFHLVINSSSVLCYKMQIFANETKNDYLFKQVDFTPKKLAEGTRDKAVDRCFYVVNLAQNLINQVAKYDIHQNELNTIREQIDTCRQTEARRISMQSEKTNLHNQLDECMARIKANFLILDKMMLVYVQDANAIERYKNSRASKAYSRPKTNKKKTEQAIVIKEVY